ncbi:MAG TPA: sugar-binding domain-containing protein [Candidatus Limnocylindrales bacterium]
MADVDRLVRASRLYYELGQTQERIAELLGVTRPQVSRLLKRARAEGIVEIRVIDRTTVESVDADRLQERYGLHAIHLAPRLGGPEDLTRRMVGRVAAYVMREVLRDGLTVGVGEGAAIGATLDAMTDDGGSAVRITTVALNGGGWSVAGQPAAPIRLASIVGGFCQELPAPGIVATPELRRALLEHVGLQAVVAMWNRLDVAIFGIGSYLRADNWLGADTVRELEERGAVGEVIVAPFDIDGRFVSERLRERTIGFDARELPRVPTTIAVATGTGKVAPILGALRAGVMKVLVTDEATAAAVLALDDETGAHQAKRELRAVGPGRPEAVADEIGAEPRGRSEEGE